MLFVHAPNANAQTLFRILARVLYLILSSRCDLSIPALRSIVFSRHAPSAIHTVLCLIPVMNRRIMIRLRLISLVKERHSSRQRAAFKRIIRITARRFLCMSFLCLDAISIHSEKAGVKNNSRMAAQNFCWIRRVRCEHSCD